MVDGHCPTGQCLLTGTPGAKQTEVTAYVAARKPPHEEGKGDVCLDGMLSAPLLVENHCGFLRSRLSPGGMQSMTSAPPEGKAGNSSLLFCGEGRGCGGQENFWGLREEVSILPDSKGHWVPPTLPGTGRDGQKTKVPKGWTVNPSQTPGGDRQSEVIY